MITDLITYRFPSEFKLRNFSLFYNMIQIGSADPW